MERTVSDRNPTAQQLDRKAADSANAQFPTLVADSGHALA
jgi:hypothetical protein